MNGLVLDKKRLRTMMAGVFTVFTTVVPFLLTLYSASSEAVAIYGQIANDTAIYAYRHAHQNDQILHAELLWHCSAGSDGSPDHNGFAVVIAIGFVWVG
jgi:hypothetical protein